MKSAFAFLAIFFISCNFSNKKGIAIKKPASHHQWVNDTLGCKLSRSKDMALQIIKKHHLMYNTEEHFLKFFQAPDEEFRTQIQQVLRYYFNSKCQRGKLISTGEMCYAEFYFRGGKLVETNFECN
ncbi:hypothetical protein [Mucilaginibacter terrae]|uniref:Lipoprotein n=1 Tax=Mucilaginibacter terrae TaxID=1955052 RepID=A0ABU3GU73_9SPHI|nr:hypothetical protein [Mucilaginibacter terrae]MDT3403121.1 hypothetical protein [Mucilaginibacter terrae]